MRHDPKNLKTAGGAHVGMDLHRICHWPQFLARAPFAHGPGRRLGASMTMLRRIGRKLKRLPGKFGPPKRPGDDDPFFNADPATILADARPKIVLVHVGKCAGETVKRAVAAHVADTHSLYEMHCYDADVRIAECLQSDAPDLSYVVCARDPIDRFVSAFNWDKHNLFARGKLTGTQYAPFYEEMPFVNDLVEALRSPDDALNALAHRFRAFGHMRMGQAWYTPVPSVARLPRDRTYLCEMATLRADVVAAVKGLSGADVPDDYAFPNDKENYKAERPDGYFSKHLSDEARVILREELSDDYEVLDALKHLARGGQ